MAQYRLSRRADADLDAIWLYIARDNPDAADELDAQLHAAMKMLSQFPGLGHLRADVKNPRYRFWNVGSYVIGYYVRGKTVTIVRVVHGARDMRKIFK